MAGGRSNNGKIPTSRRYCQHLMMLGMSFAAWQRSGKNDFGRPDKPNKFSTSWCGDESHDRRICYARDTRNDPYDKIFDGKTYCVTRRTR